MIYHKTFIIYNFISYAEDESEITWADLERELLLCPGSSGKF